MPSVRQFLHTVPDLRGDPGQISFRRRGPDLFCTPPGQRDHILRADPAQDAVLTQIQLVPQLVPSDADIPRPVAQGAQLPHRVQQRQPGQVQAEGFRQGRQLAVLQVGAQIRRHVLLQISFHPLPGCVPVREQFRKGDLTAVPQVRRDRGPYMRGPGVLHCARRGDRAAEHVAQDPAFPLRDQASPGEQLRRPGQVIPDPASLLDQFVHLLRQRPVSGTGERGIMDAELPAQVQPRVLHGERSLRAACGRKDRQRGGHAACPADHAKELHIHPSVNYYFTSFWAPEQVRRALRRLPRRFDTAVPPRI